MQFGGPQGGLPSGQTGHGRTVTTPGGMGTGSFKISCARRGEEGGGRSREKGRGGGESLRF